MEAAAVTRLLCVVMLGCAPAGGGGGGGGSGGVGGGGGGEECQDNLETGPFCCGRTTVTPCPSGTVECKRYLHGGNFFVCGDEQPPDGVPESALNSTWCGSSGDGHTASWHLGGFNPDGTASGISYRSGDRLLSGDCEAGAIFTHRIVDGEARCYNPNTGVRVGCGDTGFGRACEADDECEGAICVSTSAASYCSRPCDAEAACPTGYACDHDGTRSLCLVEVRLPLGADCGGDDECGSRWCHEERGYCTAECLNEDCGEGLICDARFECIRPE